MAGFRIHFRRYQRRSKQPPTNRKTPHEIYRFDRIFNENHFGPLRPLIFAGKTEAEERLASLEEPWNRPCLCETLLVHHPLVVSLHLVPARNVLPRVTLTGDADSCAGQRAASRPASILCIRLAG